MVLPVSGPLGKEWLCLLDPCPAVQPRIIFQVMKEKKARRHSGRAWVGALQVSPSPAWAVVSLPTALRAGRLYAGLKGKTFRRPQRFSSLRLWDEENKTQRVEGVMLGHLVKCQGWNRAPRPLYSWGSFLSDSTGLSGR